MEIKNSTYKIKFLTIFLAFFMQGYSLPLDTIKQPNCPNGLLVQINGNFRCIDTALHYYPLIEFCNEEELYSFRLKSLNLQLLEEDKWYNEEIRDDRMRIFYLTNSAYFYGDSIVLYSFFKQDMNTTKIIKKEMPVFHYHYWWGDSVFCLYDRIILGNWVSIPSDSVFRFIEKNKIVNYKQTEFIINKTKMRKLIKQLKALKQCETFDLFHIDSTFVIEYFYKGSNFLLIAAKPTPWWSRRSNYKICPRKPALKIMKWLQQY